ncbi:hypothetical protein [Thalassotalea agarivorans]|uniref:Outer membrane protein beta-barrel domain-containing protein n=1 Tax=Thalassotalea agarivorans TaxID=349064 RepID=A0A1I0E7A5_THASX|nr:hypothetical protein [Thalassotalea agarivorans]SET41054.1 hypothetical protein SAMN05660429_01759 [Thalassotalea agarivorans]
MKSILTGLALTALLFSFQSSAEEYEDAVFGKHATLGAGYYVLEVNADSEDFGDDQFTGYVLSGGYAFSNEVGVRVNYYMTEHSDLSSLENDGFDLLGLWGSGLTEEGFKAYIGGGFYSEKWELSELSFSESFSGLQLAGGLGYSWEAFTLDGILTLRETSKYEDFFEDAGINADASAVTFALVASIRF